MLHSQNPALATEVTTAFEELTENAAPSDTDLFFAEVTAQVAPVKPPPLELEQLIEDTVNLYINPPNYGQHRISHSPLLTGSHPTSIAALFYRRQPMIPTANQLDL